MNYKKIIFVGMFILISFMVGCLPKPVIRPVIQDTEIINTPFDKVWEAIVSTLAERSLPIETIEKESGLVTTKFVIFASGSGITEVRLKEIAKLPSGSFLDPYSWKRARYSINVFVSKREDEVTSIKITTHIEGFESMQNKDWMVCYSKGVIEKGIFDSIKAKIYR